MTKSHKTREEPKLRVEDLEKDTKPKKQWPKDEPVVDQEEDDNEIIGVLDHPSYIELEKKLTETEAKANDAWNQQLRLQAELDNVRRRAQKDVENARKYSLEKFASELLPVLDSLERALLSDVNDNEFAKKIHEGIELTMSLFLKTLEKFSIKQVDPLGESFNPELHQAIATQPNQEVPPNTVVEVLQKGYTLNDRLIRPALVVVAAKD